VGWQMEAGPDASPSLRPAHMVLGAKFVSDNQRREALARVPGGGSMHEAEATRQRLGGPTRTVRQHTVSLSACVPTRSRVW
jgi:hypothetical protein